MRVNRTRLRLLTMAVSVVAATITYAATTRNEPGDFDYYALVISWSPTYCAGVAARGRSEPQCDAERPYAFVLHGLWPQYETGYPENCRAAKKPWVPKPVIERMLDIMPNSKLVIHEYRKHGVCSGLEPDRYFDLARKLFGSVRIPPQYIAPAAPIETTTAEIEAAFLAANPKLDASMISIACGRNRLKEIRICFTRDGTPRSCGENELQSKLCRRDQLTVLPVRRGRAGASNI